jgi:SAM-dependent methyltransferase
MSSSETKASESAASRKGRPARNPFKWAFEKVRRRGLGWTLRKMTSLVADYTFDWKHGTRTMKCVEVDRLQTSSDNKDHAVHYQATKARPLLRLLESLKLPPESVFVDLGSGKGRALLIASKYRFKRVVGVEFCSALCVEARKNYEIFQQRSFSLSPVEIIECDAAKYEFKEDENIFYLYNPFGQVVLRQVLANIGRSLERHPRPIWLIYNTAEERAVIAESGFLSQMKVTEISGTEFSLYTNQAAARASLLAGCWTTIAAEAFCSWAEFGQLVSI